MTNQKPVSLWKQEILSTPIIISAQDVFNKILLCECEKIGQPVNLESGLMKVPREAGFNLKRLLQVDQYVSYGNVWN